MGSEIQENASVRSEIWLTNKSDEGEDFSNHSFTSASFRPSKTRNDALTHELRMFIGTWNVGGRSPGHNLATDLDQWLNLNNAVDIYVLGFQEIVPLNPKTLVGVLEDQTEARKWNLLVGKALNNNNHDQTMYMLVANKKMVGIFVTIWMKTEMLRKYSVSNVKVCSVACGIMGCLGNKGSVSVSMSIEGTSFCFVNAHLAPGEKKGDENRRNQQVFDTFKRATFSKIPHGSYVPLPLDILGHELSLNAKKSVCNSRIFWFGDLNYRLNLEDSLARELIRWRNYAELQRFDQLKKELEGDGVFKGWNEGSIEFAPTYKYYLSSSNCYTVSLPTRSGDKHRTPAWCDRIIWRGKGIQQLSYVCGDSKFSDHRPVSSVFTTEIELLSSNPRAIASSKVHPCTNNCRKNKRKKKKGQTKVAEEPRMTLGELIRREAEESAMQIQ
ncbi:hypothetical protein V2J09_012075 [Rumex salicifolius]